MVQKKQNPRIQVPVSPKTRKMLQTYADASGQSLARVCEEILQETAPIMEGMAEALLEAKRAPAKAVENMAEALDKKLAEIDQLKMDLSPKATGKRRRTS